MGSHADIPSVEVAPLTLNPDGVPVSEKYGDVYHSSAGGHAQARHVFIGGNGLPMRWANRDHFTILETGFGLGINFLATWLAWRNDMQACKALNFVSVEKHPFSAADLAIAHAAFPEFAELSQQIIGCWPALTMGEHRIEVDGGRVVLRLVFGDAMAVLPQIDVQVDAFYLDGFSPAKNPDLWSPSLCKMLAHHAASGATLATWSVAGMVRQALSEAGFVVAKKEGFAGKRQMLVGHLAPNASFGY